jgi:hypothetical protein
MKINYSLKEIARDFIALGSPIFFILVIVRVSLLSNFEYLSQFVIAGILFIVLFFFIKINMYSGLSLIVLIFTTLYYNNLRFWIFASLAYLGLLFSLIYLKEDKKKIAYGVLLGIISTIISYFTVNLIF